MDWSQLGLCWTRPGQNRLTRLGWAFLGKTGLGSTRLESAALVIAELGCTGLGNGPRWAWSVLLGLALICWARYNWHRLRLRWAGRSLAQLGGAGVSGHAWAWLR